MPEGQVAQVFPATILLTPEDRATPAQLLTSAKAKALDPAIFDDARFVPYFWTAEISNNRLDAYFTRMAPSSLKNYAEDAKAGISFQDSHQTDGIHRTFGQSLGARYYGPGNQARPAGVAAVEADFYSVLGLDGGIDTYINKVRAGITRDVSIGFYGGTYRCSICNKDMRDYSDWSNYCPHYPGQVLALKDPQTGKPTDERQTVEASIEDAHLAETSGVYDGATPDASILVVKARELADAGKLDPKEARFIEARYRVRIPGTAPAFAVARDLSRPGDEGTRARATGATVKEEAMTLEEQLRALLADHGLAEGGDIAAHIRTLTEGATARINAAVAARDEQVRGVLAQLDLPCEGGDLLADLRGHKAALDTVRAQARDGGAYREQLIADALAEGVRAFGDAFDQAARRQGLERLTIEEIKERRAAWTEIGDRRNPGGRATKDEGEDGAQPRRAPVRHIGAYRA